MSDAATLRQLASVTHGLMRDLARLQQQAAIRHARVPPGVPDDAKVGVIVVRPAAPYLHPRGYLLPNVYDGFVQKVKEGATAPNSNYSLMMEDSSPCVIHDLYHVGTAHTLLRTDVRKAHLFEGVQTGLYEDIPLVAIWGVTAMAASSGTGQGPFSGG